MIVRERSNVSESPRKGPDWPPKSPLQAILSSPQGRRRHEERQRARPVSPSPIKRSFSPTKGKVAPLSVSSSDDEEGEEDEETLQLKLKAIEAKLKLKKLQQAKGRPKSTPSLRDDPFTDTEAAGPDRGRVSDPKQHTRTRIQVSVSPPRERRAPEEPRSPARVLMGIDKGLKARDVSLKRSANMHGAPKSNPRNPAPSHAQLGSQRQHAFGTGQQDIPKPKSFSERIAESRENGKKSEEKRERIQRSRSRGFGLGAEDLLEVHGHQLKSAAHDRIDNASRQLQEHTLGVKAQVAAASATMPAQSTGAPATAAIDLGPGLEPFSGLHLSRRKMGHQTLTRVLAEKTLYPLPNLLKTVKGPTYDPPDVEGDYVVFGIIASKSSPRNHAARKSTSSMDAEDDARAAGVHKFMALRLTDFKWEVDLFLFDTAFSRFWKLTPGTVVAVLNPGIMPPRRGREDTGIFALKLASSEDTILEIGTARDLGFCKSVKQDGQECGSWVNSNKTEFCEFHINLQVAKARASRMEVNTMVRFGARDNNSKRSVKGRDVSHQEQSRTGLLPAGGKEFDYETREAFYAVPSRPGRGAATLLDDAEFGTKRDREQRLEKRRKEREREKELAARLGKIGTKAGGEYLRKKQNVNGGANGTATGSSQTSGDARQADTDAIVQGLLERKAAHVTLSPVHKRKRGGNGTTSSEPVGWGGAYKRGLLLSPKKPVLSSQSSEAAHDDGSLSPSKKRARFMLDDKGLREPGRDSFGLVGNQQRDRDDDDDDDDDDDELDIIR